MPTTPAAFVPTACCLHDLVHALLAVEARLATRLSEVTATFAVHDPQLVALKVLSEALLQEADEGCETVDDILRCETFSSFESCETIPPRLLQPGSASNLLGYIRSAPARAKKRAMDEARARAEDSAAMLGFREAAAAERRALVGECAPALSRSDHLPIQVELRVAGPGTPAATSEEAVPG